MHGLLRVAMLPLELAAALARFDEALDLVRENNELTRQTNALLRTVDADAVKLLGVVAALQRDMPALTDSAETLGNAAGRIPGLRGR